MLSPKKVKWRKPQKGNMRGMSNSGDYVSFGSYGLKAMEPGWITSRQIESARIIISRKINVKKIYMPFNYVMYFKQPFSK